MPGIAQANRPSAQATSVSLLARGSVLSEKKREAEMQRLGISTREELPAGSLELGFGVNREEVLSKVLTDHFGKSTTVFKRDNEFLYIDPDDGIVKRANPDARGAIGLGLPVIGDMVGTLGAGFITRAAGPGGQLAAETAGSGLGTATGEYLRLMTGKVMGVHDLTWDEVFKKAGIEGVKASAATGIVGGAMTAYKGLKNALQGGKFMKSGLIDAGYTEKQADLVIDEVNRILGRKGVKGTLANRVDDVRVAAKEREIRDSIVFAQDFAERDLADQLALTEALEKITKTDVKGSGAISQFLGKRAMKRVEQAKKIVAQNTDDLQKQLDSIGRIGKGEVGDPTRTLIMAKRDAAEQAKDKLWKEVETFGGYDEATEKYGVDIVMGDETSRLKTILDRRAATATTKIGKSQSIFAAPPKGEAATIKEAPKGQIRLSGKPAAPVKQDLADYNNEISRIRKELRGLYRNRQYGDPQTRELQQVKDAMVADRRKALLANGQEDLLHKIELAEAQTREFFKTYDNNIIGDLMAKTDDGVFKVKSKDFVDKMLKADRDEFENLMSVIDDHPEVIQMWREGISDAYKRKAFSEGKWSKRASDSFLSDHKDILEQVFSKSDLDSFVNAGELSRKVAKQSKQLTKIISDANTKYGAGKMAGLDPDSLVKFVNSSSKVKTPTGQIETPLNKIKYLKNVTKDRPEIFDDFASEYMDNLRKQVTDYSPLSYGDTTFNTGSGFINPSKMNKIINENSDIILELKGQQYLDDMKTINNAVQLFSKKMNRLTGDEGIEAIKQSIRAGVAPPLTREGRIFTAIMKLETRFRHKVMAGAFLEPKELNAFAKALKHSTPKREAAELMASLGIALPDDEPEVNE